MEERVKYGTQKWSWEDGTRAEELKAERATPCPERVP